MIDRAFWSGRSVFLTGHTGFKGAWLCLVLRALGARVSGLALPPDSTDGIFAAARVESLVGHTIGDIRDGAVLRRAVEEARPDVVIHMAAQSLVRVSYEQPVETYAVNLLGTVHLLEALRHAPGVAAALIVTSDKCYENLGAARAQKEGDPLGGHDPYSNSKACAELAVDAYRRSYFHRNGSVAIASGRAGNVIGGGDWGRYRIVPDAIRAFRAGESLHVRNPKAVRPWQHALDPLFGYLMICERLAKGAREFARGWNFGPTDANDVPVEVLANELVRRWSGGAHWAEAGGDHPHEAAYLRLDCSDAIRKLGWRSLFPLQAALDLTVEWYRAQSEGGDMQALSFGQIDRALAAEAE